MASIAIQGFKYSHPYPRIVFPAETSRLETLSSEMCVKPGLMQVTRHTPDILISVALEAVRLWGCCGLRQLPNLIRMSDRLNCLKQTF